MSRITFTYLLVTIFLIALYIYFLFSFTTGTEKDTFPVLQTMPCIINTCDKFMPEAKACAHRALVAGIKNINFSNGDNDSRIDKDKVYKKNRSFLSTCLNMVERETPYILMLEEDSLFQVSRLDILSSTLEWAINHLDAWDLVYGGCVAINPVYVDVNNPNRLRAYKGQLGGHCVLVSLSVAQDYVKDFDHITAFDVWLSRRAYRSLVVSPAAVCQQNNPSTTPAFIPGTHHTHQDATLIAWPVIEIISVTTLTTIAFYITYKCHSQAKQVE